MHFIILVLYLIAIIGIFSLVRKIGYPWYYGFLSFIPVVNALFFIYICYSEWPIENELNKCKIRLGEPSTDINENEDDTVCLSCKTVIPKGLNTCAKCGWTYK